MPFATALPADKNVLDVDYSNSDYSLDELASCDLLKQPVMPAVNHLYAASTMKLLKKDEATICPYSIQTNLYAT
jgi:hypothetical protein